MKKVLIYGTMAVVCVTGMFALTGCSKSDENVKEEVSGVETVEEAKRPTEIVLSDNSSAWPSGVYDFYGIPEYKDGTIVYSRPNSKYGDVYIKTTLEDLDNYIKDVKTKGIRVDEKNKTDTTAKYKMFDKETGKGFYVEVTFESKTIDTGSEVKDYDLYMSICEDEYPEKNIQTNLLAEYGFKDEDITPKNVEIFNAEVLNYGSQKKVEFRPGFDVTVSEENNKAYHAQIVDACASLSDDGNLENMDGEKVTPQEAKDEMLAVWKFTSGGKKYKINFTIQSGIGVTYNFLIQ